MKPKLTQHIKQICNSYIVGQTTYELAKQYCVCPGTILRIIRKEGIKINHVGSKTSCRNYKQPTVDSTTLVLSGKYSDLCESTIRKHVKRFLVIKNGHKCCICNNSTWNNQPIPLICDHIDGNSNNNNLENFRLVCPNCDHQLPTFGSKNRGNGRLSEKLRYHANKRRVG